ncbi:RNA-guided endonuclease TnpB family protein (plasmid) [Pseudoalteromonas sp. HL-AS2]|uniref:RNA-guided endonuclease TnpB family protein n=1 Tax=Pseudoalteromonas sp. HL-AS2 TaxID=3071082 RepID=UPI002815FF7B|nr:RNA-guided endonuclease TnpB family protein [Pseudoalteromonas sp. HL-AS2]WMS96318.1 RNA-guided endonuclease TnpB family protein [Pseudoalteromonas sp. HL-AS2]
MILIAYKYRVYPNNEQALMLTHTFGCVRFAYNSALGYSKEQYDLGNKTNYNDWSKNLTQLKKNPDFAWLKDVSSVPLQQALKHLDKGFKSFFKSGFGYPKFKNKHGNQSVSYMSNGFKWEADKQSLTLAKMKQPLKIKWSRSFTGKPSSLTVSKTKSGKYFISILVKEDIKKRPVANKTVGVDVGIKDLAICSDGTKFNNPRLTNKYASKLAKAQRKLAKKKKGSNNFNKQKRVVARIYEKIANSRKDFTQKMTTKLINENQVIGIESLKVKNMVKNRKLSKHIHDANFGEIVRQLEYKADWYGRKVSAISQWFPSSKMCNECGSLYSGKWSLAIRTWSCECGAIHDRDHNAAINIHNEGLRLIA